MLTVTWILILILLFAIETAATTTTAINDITTSTETVNKSSIMTSLSTSVATTAKQQYTGDVDDIACSVIKNFNTFNIDYKLKDVDVCQLLCRCKGMCFCGITLAPDVREYVHYEIYAPLSDQNKPKFIAVVVAFSVLLLVGLVGNITTIVGLLRWVKKTTPTFAFIISLSSSDLLLLCVCMPLKVTEYFHLADVFTELSCKASYYIRDCTMIISVLTLTVISFERYYAICYPLKVMYRCTWSRAIKIIIFTWILSLCLALPTIFMTKFYLPAGSLRKQCEQQSNDDLHLVLYFTYYLGLLFVIPVIVMTFTYGRSCYTLWRSTQISQQLQGKDRHYQAKSAISKKPLPKDVDDSKSRRQVIKILILIVIIFTVCWGPTLLTQLLSVMNVITSDRNDIRLATEALTYISSALNPYLFMAMSSQFRQAILRFVRCRGRSDVLSSSSAYKDSSSATMHTMNTSGIGMSESGTEINV